MFGVRQVIFASSMGVLSGAYAREPVVDDFSVTRPDSIYDAAKLFSENLGLFYKRQYGFDYRGLRLPNVIGPGTETHGYLEYFNKTIEESARGNPYTLYVEPRLKIPIMYIGDAIIQDFRHSRELESSERWISKTGHPDWKGSRSI